MMRTIRNRSGFTLVEVLVILAILAAIGGMLVPSVTNQVRKGQVSRAAQDLLSVKTAAEAFFSDVNRFPGDADDLAGAVVANAASTDADIKGNAYPTGLASLWKGPYLDRTLATDTTSIPTSFNGRIVGKFSRTTSTTNNLEYLTVVLTGVAEDEFRSLDEVIDGGDDAGMASGGTGANGRVRWDTAAVAGAGKHVKYLAVPIN